MAAPGRLRAPKGAALLILMIILVAGISAALLSRVDSVLINQGRSQATAEALSKAKAALLAWSVTHADTVGGSLSRPGELPCPDFGNDGVQDATCLSGQLGRFPWKTLGVEKILDGSGTELWYAVSAGFRLASLDKRGINSDATGALLLYDSTGASLTPTVDQQLAAVILAPGEAVPSAEPKQLRRSSDEAADYAESALGRDNRVTGGPFVTGPVRDANGTVILNDVVMGVRASEVILAAESRALMEAERALGFYKAARSNDVPAPGNPTSAACLASVTDVTVTVTACSSDSDRCYGRLPEDSLSSYAAGWFTKNGWGRVLPYAVLKDRVTGKGGRECSDTMTLDGNAVPWVLFAPGPIVSGQTRPSSVLSNYLEDSANQDAWTAGATNRAAFVTPNGNDRLRKEP